jgi:hypothetical protein
LCFAGRKKSKELCNVQPGGEHLTGWKKLDEEQFSLVEQQHHATDLRPVPRPCYFWLSHVRFSHCYTHLGKLDALYEHNRTALRYLPDDPHLLANERKLREAIPELSYTAPPLK